MALLHPVAVDHRLPVRAGPRRAAGARRQQAAAPHGPPDRVLHPRRRARPGPLRRGGRHAPGGRHLPPPAARHRLRTGGRAGRPSTRRSCAPRWPSGTAWGRSSRTSATPIRAARAPSTRRAAGCWWGTPWPCFARRRRRVDRLRRHRSAVQPAAAHDDGRRPPRRRPREPAHRLRDGQRRPGRPGQQPRLSRPTWTAWAAIFAEIRRVLRPGRYAAVIVRDAYQDGRYRFTGVGSRGAGGGASAWCPRAT